jgi:PAS domain S-box-containing protein
MNKGVEILIAEDSPTQAEKLKHLLNEHDYTVTVVANGKQALAEVHQRKPTLIITDVTMPEMDGYVLCRAIKSQNELRDIPVILVTSLSSPQDVIKGLECGADNFILKPYDEKYLLARIDYILRNRELRRTDKLQVGVEIYFRGQSYFINSERQQILDLLISTYEGAVQINDELSARQKELTRSEEELGNQSRVLKSILQSLGDGVIVADENGRFLLFNPAAEKILGFGPTEGSPGDWSTRYGLFLPDKITTYPADEFPLARAMRGEAVDGAEVFVRNSKAPQGVWINATARPLRDEGGGSAGGVVVFRDVTTSKQAEEALLQAKEEVERASKFKDQFLSTMSHELRTPLNAVLGFSDLLGEERYGTLNDRQRRYVNHIHTGGKHLLRLISDILDLSKIEAGRLELAFESVPVERTFQEVLDALRPLADKKSLTLFQQADSCLAVRADVTRLKQVLMNLLGNAIKFTPEGGRIDLEARLMDGKVRLGVRDNGPGIPLEEQKLIFETFYRLQQSGKAPEGTGLGLAITQRLVESHGGLLELESQPDQGSCFYFSLSVAPITRVAHDTEKVSPRRQTGSARILVIEDDPVSARLIQSQLATSGYEAVVCEELSRALEIAVEQQPDAITMDLVMKPTNGWELLLQFKNDPRTASIPVIVVSIMDQPGLGTTLGADEYVVKPVDRATLLAAVERCLGDRETLPPARPVLIVEDDTATREFISELLKGQGYTIVIAADGEQARARIADSLPALVILDLQLPKVSGFDLLAEWRATPRTADLPVFVLTSKDLTREEEKYLRAHAESLLRKQESWEGSLIKQLQRVLRSSQPVQG